MPAKTPNITPVVADKLLKLGKRIRDHRKAMRLSATVVAEAAGMSRMTLHRVEKGESSVTMGAYLNAIEVLGLNLGIVEQQDALPVPEDRRNMIPARIPLADYPELKKLAWQVHGVDALTPLEALSIYERNRRYMDVEHLEERERQLIEALQLALGGVVQPDDKL